MTDLKTYIRQLRNAADALENLLGFKDGPAAAETIRQDLRSNGNSTAAAPPQKGFKYNGTHWTQTRAGRKHMKKLQRLRHSRKNGAAKTRNARALSRDTIMAALKKAGRPVQSGELMAELASGLDLKHPKQAVWGGLSRLKREGLLRRTAKGWELK